jgi:hypothetical protein
MAVEVLVELAVATVVAVVVEVEVVAAGGVPFCPPVLQNVHHHND